MTAFESLAREIRSCDICSAHLPLGPRPVFQANPAAKILVVGQAPGTAVHKTGIAFNDPSGDRLRTWMGIDRNTFYDASKIAIIPMGFCYPGRGKGGDLPPRPECATTWREKLLSHLTDVNLIIAIGRYAIDWHLGPAKKDNLTTIVGNWRNYWPAVMPLPHPSPRNTMWLRRNPWVETELIPTLQCRIAALL